jgi:diacylglycerol kinase (ATP)
MGTSKNQPFARRLRFALAGLRAGFRSERSLRAHGLALAGLCGALLVLRPAPLWWALALLAAAAVIAAEFINTALEQLADHLHPAQHIRIRAVKDSAAAAVLVVAAGAVAVFAALVAEWLRGR